MIGARILFLASTLLILGACHEDHDHPHSPHDHPHDDHGDHSHDDHGHDHPEEISFPREYQGRVGFRADEARLTSIQPSLPAYATLRPAPDADAYITAPFDGRIHAPRGGIPDVGDTVSSGQIVAYVLPRQDPAQTANLRAELERAEVELSRAERDLARVTGLVESGALPERRLADAISDRDIARTRVERGRQAMGQVAIHASISGVVTERTLVDGAYVTAGQPLLRVIDSSRVRLHIMVPEANLPRVAPTAGAWLALPEQDEPYHVRPGTNATLLSSGSFIDPHSRTATLIYDLQDPPEGLLPGAFLTAHLYTGPPREVLAIPRTAVLEEEGLDVVFRVRGRETFSRQVVTLGIADAHHVEVLQGLTEGQLVVSRGAYYVRLAAASTDDVGHGHSH